MSEKRSQQNSYAKWILAVTLCAAAAVLGVFLYSVTSPAYSLRGAQMEAAIELSAGEKMHQALSLSDMESAQPRQDTEDRININLADVQTLQSLPGIGERLAQRIVEYRSYNGPFETIEDLMLVSGIGQKKFLALRDLITV